MIHTLIFIGALVAMFFYGMFIKLDKPKPRVVEAPVEVVKEAPVVAAAPTAPTEAAAPVIDLEKGHKLYQVHCISCHNKDPNMKGAIGPEQVYAPLDVFKVKVVTGRYPDVLPVGFVPKRKTKQMKKFPQLNESDVASIHAWIQSVKK